MTSYYPPEVKLAIQLESWKGSDVWSEALTRFPAKLGDTDIKLEIATVADEITRVQRSLEIRAVESGA